MPDTLCIAELADGRRALCYINPEERRAELVLVLRPEDLEPKPWKDQEEVKKAAPQLTLTIDFDRLMLDGLETLNHRLMAAWPLPIPPPPPKPRITPADLLRMAGETPPPRECPVCGCTPVTGDTCPTCSYRFDA